jgi:hypothetical protein
LKELTAQSTRYHATIPSSSADRVQKIKELRRPWALRTEPVREAATPDHSTILMALLLVINGME